MCFLHEESNILNEPQDEWLIMQNRMPKATIHGEIVLDIGMIYPHQKTRSYAYKFEEMVTIWDNLDFK